MHTFLTGGTGSIGSAVLAELLAGGHDVTALSRSADSDAVLQQVGATPIRGDLENPEDWIEAAVGAGTFIHLASTFADDMAALENRLLDLLIAQTSARPTPLRLLYTGGCWLYGRTGSAVAHEQSPFNPPQSFAWATEAIARLQAPPGLSVAILHPAMVYDEAGGVFDRYLKALRGGRAPAIWGSDKTRWPLVHRLDVAAAYGLLAKRPDQTGAFNIVAETGVTAGDITDVLSQQAGVRARAAVVPEKWVLMRHGPWAKGPMLDQQMRSARMADLGWQPQVPDFRNLRYRV